jgi:hypothetical protein
VCSSDLTQLRCLECQATYDASIVRYECDCGGLLDVEHVLALEFSGTRYDCGTKQGYLQATVKFALQHPEVKDEFQRFLDQFTPQITQQQTPQQNTAQNFSAAIAG